MNSSDLLEIAAEALGANIGRKRTIEETDEQIRGEFNFASKERRGITLT
jgi:hypothetical protein